MVQSPPRVGAGELDLLEMLWRERSVTLSQAHAALGKPIGYTTVQTRLNRLVKKGAARRTDDRPARYEPAITPQQVSRRDLKLLRDRVCGGNVIPLVAHLVRDAKLTSDEFRQLKEMIEQAEKDLNHRNR